MAPKNEENNGNQIATVGSFAMDPNFDQNLTIKAYVRLKPPHDEGGDSKKKKSRNEKRAWNIQRSGALESIVQKGTARKLEGKTLFHFNQVFEEEAITPFLYKSMARSMVHTVLNGKHASIFAYGPTGSGKTFTMQGDGQAQSGQAGIIQLVVADLFRFMRMGDKSERDFVIKVSYLEIYNEKIRDLLADDVGSTASQGTPQEPVPTNSAPEVQVRVGNNGAVIVDCTLEQVETVDDVLELLVQGNEQRIVAKADPTTHSARSHALFRITVESIGKMGTEGADVLRVSDFNLIDMAGAELLKPSGAGKKLQKGGGKVNQSLQALSSVVESLSLPEKKRPGNINYKQSKLTTILEPHLAGNAEVAVICCAAPTKAFVEDSRASFKFGNSAKKITLKPLVNELVDESATIRKLENELAEARRMISSMKRGGGAGMNEGRKDSMQASLAESDDESYGYDDMDAGPGHREHNIPKPEDYVPPAEQADPTPQMGGREYVMPKSQDGPGIGGRDYVMPKDHEIPLDLGDEMGEDSQYVMPEGQDDPEQMDKFLSGRVGEDTDDEESEEDLQGSEGAFQLDAVTPADADKTVTRYMQGRRNTADEEQLFDDDSDEEMSVLDRVNTKFKTSAQGSQSRGGTGPTEEESIDGPLGSYAQASRNRDDITTPDTLRGATYAARSQHGTLSSTGGDGRGGNRISWDTMDLDTMQPDQVGKPLKAMQSIYKREAPLPEDITIMRVSIPEDPAQLCLTDRLQNAEARAVFLQGKLDKSDDLVEAIFKDLERARLCIHDLVYRNVQLSAKLKEKKRDDIKEEYQESEVVMEQYWLLKGAMYIGLFFFVTGGYEFFMAAVILIWLILEVNLSSIS